jgi:ubiquinone/menaquinone biosynthesis C-methylase UbiE
VHRDTTVGEFTTQAESFNASAGANDARILDAIVSLCAPGVDEHWLEAACGPGVIARRLAPGVATVTGRDLTPAMVELAQREAAAAGLDNVSFEVGDATCLGAAEGEFDGAVTRFSLHHVPLPVRLVRELARVVKPGGPIVLVDHLADADPEAAAWAQEIERLRDPSHWASPTLARAHRLLEQSGLVLDYERFLPLELDFEDWLERGSGGAVARDVIEQALELHPRGVTCFDVSERDGRRILRLRVWLARVVRPA